jgi:hypothetical protein
MFNAKFQSIQIAKSEISSVVNTKPEVSNKAQSNISAGAQIAKKATAKQESWAFEIFGGFLGLK